MQNMISITLHVKICKNMIKNFKILKKTKKTIGTGGVICLYPEIIPLNESNFVIPVGCIV